MVADSMARDDIARRVVAEHANRRVEGILPERPEEQLGAEGHAVGAGVVASAHRQRGRQGAVVVLIEPAVHALAVDVGVRRYVRIRRGGILLTHLQVLRVVGVVQCVGRYVVHHGVDGLVVEPPGELLVRRVEAGVHHAGRLTRAVDPTGVGPVRVHVVERRIAGELRAAEAVRQAREVAGVRPQRRGRRRIAGRHDVRRPRAPARRRRQVRQVPRRARQQAHRQDRPVRPHREAPLPGTVADRARKALRAPRLQIRRRVRPRPARRHRRRRARTRRLAIVVHPHD